MEHLTKKYGEAARQRFSSPGNPLDMAGQRVGVTFNKDRRVIPTMAPHRAIEWCSQKYDMNKTDSFMEALFKSYFTDGNDVSKQEEILRCAAEVELDTEGLRAVLSSEELAYEVEQKSDFAQRNLRVTGVPFFLIEPSTGDGSGKRPVAFSGAQPPELIAEQLESVYDGERNA